MIFKRRKKQQLAAVEIESPRELTGIEKMELERAERLQAEARAEEQRQRLATQARIAEIEKEIEPQLAELVMLRAKMNPWAQMLNAYANSINFTTQQQQFLNAGQQYAFGGLPMRTLGSITPGSGWWG